MITMDDLELTYSPKVCDINGSAEIYLLQANVEKRLELPCYGNLLFATQYGQHLTNMSFTFRAPSFTGDKRITLSFEVFWELNVKTGELTAVKGEFEWRKPFVRPEPGSIAFVVQHALDAHRKEIEQRLYTFHWKAASMRYTACIADHIPGVV